MNKVACETVDILTHFVSKNPSGHPALLDPTRLRFVVAEDDADLRFVLNHLLLEAFPAAQVAVFENGQEALHDFNRHGADLVVSNHSMPVMDGPTFVQELRERSVDLPILMVSDSPEAHREGAQAGINHFLHKTELTARLVTTVKSLLAASTHHRPGGGLLLTAHR